jgi:glycosyltransferase involved in cell wall biosynthesis
VHGRIILDITTSKFWGPRPSVGIVRTEKKVGAILAQKLDPNKITFCYFDNVLKEFFEIPITEAKTYLEEVRSTEFYDRTNSSLSTPNPVVKWARNKKFYSLLRFTKRQILSLRDRILTLIKVLLRPILIMRRKVLLGKPLEFQKSDIYMNLGLDWNHMEYISKIKEIKDKVGIKAVSLCYDLIPFKLPNRHPQEFTDKFRTYIDRIIQASDLILSISQATQNDLQEYIDKTKLAKPRLRTIRLGDGIDKNIESYPIPDYPQLKQGNFILYVSTIEPRKNHKLLYEVWLKLILGKRIEIPYMVFAGARGWMISDLLAKIESDPRLENKIVILNNLPDAQLSWLYQNCLFTVYPSFYEGWGIPVAESFQYGKLCISSDRSSLPEVGKNLSIYVDPEDTDRWAKTIEELIINPELRKQQEGKITSEYKPFTWEETVGQIRENIEQFHSTN